MMMIPADRIYGAKLPCMLPLLVTYLDFESAPDIYESPSPKETLNECLSPLHLSQPNGVSVLPVELCKKSL